VNVLTFLTGYSRKTIILAILAGIGSGVCNTGMLALIMASLKEGGGLLPKLALMFAVLCVLYPLTRYASEILLAHLVQGALLDLRMQLSKSMLAAPLRKLEELGPYRLLATLTDDIPIITSAVVLIPVISINIAIIVGGLIYLGFMSWKILLAVLSIIFLGILTYQLPASKAMGFFSLAREEADNLLKHFRTLTQAAKELKLHRRRRDAFLSNVMRPTAVSYRKHNLDGMSAYNIAASWGQTLFFVTIGLIIFILPSLMSIDAHTLTAYTLIILYIMSPLQSLITLVPAISRANVSIRKVEGLGLSLTSAVTEPVSTTQSEMNSIWRQLELKGIKHTYHHQDEDHNFMLGPIDLTFYPGEVVFIAGGNGSGKTTFAKLLTGLYVPESGEIFLDGQPIEDANRESYRQLFSVVFSDYFLFESLLGLETPTLDEEARRYLARLELSHKVRIKDATFSTTNLSQGQRKRLALLTAYLEDRPIYVFDEWAADQDRLFKDIFYCEILPDLRARAKTVIVITHDDNYYHIADRVIRLSYGRIDYSKSPASALSDL
jgi:putative ATP-binding cassette transporter